MYFGNGSPLPRRRKKKKKNDDSLESSYIECLFPQSPYPMFTEHRALPRTDASRFPHMHLMNWPKSVIHEYNKCIICGYLDM
jgi:hypothetical protein